MLSILNVKTTKTYALRGLMEMSLKYSRGVQFVPFCGMPGIFWRQVWSGHGPLSTLMNTMKTYRRHPTSISGVDRLIYSLPPRSSFLYSNVACHLHIGIVEGRILNETNDRSQNAIKYTTGKSHRE